MIGRRRTLDEILEEHRQARLCKVVAMEEDEDKVIVLLQCDDEQTMEEYCDKNLWLA